MDRVDLLEPVMSHAFEPEDGHAPAFPTRENDTMPCPPATETHRVLTGTEQAVIAIAAFDHRRSVEPAGPIARALELLFGQRRENALADEKLEILRRYAVLYRLGDHQRLPRETALFEAAGYVGHLGDEVRRLVKLSGQSR